MRTLRIVVFALLLVGCNRSTPPSVLLTAQQAQIIAVQLANGKASTVYHCQPFGDGEVPHFEQGRWVWVDHHGYGQGDLEATVELAADGSTNSVDLKLLDNRHILSPE